MCYAVFGAALRQKPVVYICTAKINFFVEPNK